MIRQRINLRTPAWGLLVRLITIAFALALIYGGVMLGLLACKVDPSRINKLTAYRTIYRHAVALQPSDFTTSVSLIAGFGGLLVFLVFAFLTFQALPRPYFTRTQVDLPENGRGATVVRPRAVERVAEFAAQGSPQVMTVAGRLGDDELNVGVGLRDVSEVSQTLADVRRRVGEQLERHQLPKLAVNVILTGYERPTRGDRP